MTLEQHAPVHTARHRLRTVNTYRESLARKLGASSAAVITRFVLTTGLTDPLGQAG